MKYDELKHCLTRYLREKLYAARRYRMGQIRNEKNLGKNAHVADKDLAEFIGISQATFYNKLSKARREMLSCDEYASLITSLYGDNSWKYEEISFLKRSEIVVDPRDARLATINGEPVMIFDRYQPVYEFICEENDAEKGDTDESKNQ